VGYTRIRGALSNLGHKVGRGTIASILKEHGIEPAPERGNGMPWSTFLRAHWDSMSATDLFTVEVWTRVKWSTESFATRASHSSLGMTANVAGRACHGWTKENQNARKWLWFSGLV
jgi:hypothetical protein